LSHNGFLYISKFRVVLSENDCIEDVENAMIQFAKLHVEAALKAASDAAFGDSKYDVKNSYPLTNIK